MIRSPLPSSENARTGIRGPATGRPLAKAPLPYLRDLSKGDIKRLIRSCREGFMTAVEVAAGAAMLSFLGVIANVFVTVRGNRSTAHEIANLQNKHAEHLEQARQRHQLQVAALDRRLAVHQEAYTLWWGLTTVAHDQDDAKRASYVRKCEDWWAKNCLYLTPDARIAFRRSYFAARDHKDCKDARDSDLVRRNWKTILAASDAIVEGAELPSWGEDEYKPVDEETMDELA